MTYMYLTEAIIIEAKESKQMTANLKFIASSLIFSQVSPRRYAFSMTAMGPQMGKIKMSKTKDTIIVIREEKKRESIMTF